MNKRIAIPIIGVLAVGLIAISFLYLQKPNKLEDTQPEIVALEEDVSTLEAGLAEAEAEVSALETELAEFEAEVLALEARISPELSVILSEIDGLIVTVDGEVAPGISGSIITRIHWDWGDGNSEDHWFLASHTYEAYGEYTITVTAYQDDGLTSTKAFIFYTPAQTPSAVSIPDLGLEATIREAIDKPEGTIYKSDLESLTMLEAPERGILNLTGLEYCVNLQYLGLWDNNISDISALAGLINLQGLDFEGNNISDISSLAGLTNLEYLGLLGNNINDISPLAGLVNLKWLNLWKNNISDISSLTGLTNLEYLGLWDNNISDISPLAGLINLQDLDLVSNNISDISPLVENSGLAAEDMVYLSDNPLSITSVDVYISQLEERGVIVTY
jgi:hypothetical protein|tara:strand:- start:400 stop:1566 length:1167 start_codon:yes stop_codon:yes gene_type:complete